MMKKIWIFVFAMALIFSLTLSVFGANEQYDEFISAMTEMVGAGKMLEEAGLSLQSQSYYAFAGASVSSLRFAVEYILYLMGEGQSLEGLCEGSVYAGWDEIASVCYSSPYPYYFEGLIWQMQGQRSKAASYFEAALINPAYPQEGVDFYYLRRMGIGDLYLLRDELREIENEIYAMITRQKLMLIRDPYCFEPSYLRAKSAEAINSGDNQLALIYAKVAVMCDPFEGLNFRNAVICSIASGDLKTAAYYLDEGLLVAPDDEGLLLIYSYFSEIVGEGL